jgi:hypothetical protein
MVIIGTSQHLLLDVEGLTGIDWQSFDPIGDLDFHPDFPNQVIVTCRVSDGGGMEEGRRLAAKVLDPQEVDLSILQAAYETELNCAEGRVSSADYFERFGKRMEDLGQEGDVLCFGDHIHVPGSGLLRRENGAWALYAAFLPEVCKELGGLASLEACEQTYRRVGDFSFKT